MRVDHRRTYLCSLGLQPLSHCLPAHDAVADVISDDRSEGIVVLPTNLGGDLLWFSLNPGVEFRMMARQRTDGCFDLLVEDTVVEGAPFVDQCVWGPVTVPEDGDLRVQLLPWYVGGEPQYPAAS